MMTDPQPNLHSNLTPKLTFASLGTPLFFAFGLLAIGMIPGSLTFALDPNAVSRIGMNEIPIPAWVFIAVWFIAYPCMGVATWLIWRKRHQMKVAVPIAVFAIGYIYTFSFWLTNGIHMTAVLDGIVLIAAYVVAYVYFQYDKMTLWLLLPWLIWMPITFVVKLLVLFAYI